MKFIDKVIVSDAYLTGSLRVPGLVGGDVTLQANTMGTTPYTWVFPQSNGTSGQILRNDGNGNLEWVTPIDTIDLNEGYIIVGDPEAFAVGVPLSGDATITSAGVLRLSGSAIGNRTLDTALIGTEEILMLDGTTLKKTNISALRTFSSTGSFTGSFTGSIRQPLTSAQIFVGNATNIAAPVAMSGDITINDSGVTAIGSQKVLTTMLDSSIVNNTTAHNSTPLDLSQTKFFVASGSTGLNRSLTYSTFLTDLRPRIATGSFTGSFTGSIQVTLPATNLFVGNSQGVATPVAISGDITISNTGVATIQDGAVDSGDLEAGIINNFTAYTTPTTIADTSLFAIADAGNSFGTRKLSYTQLTASLSSSFSSAGLFGGGGSSFNTGSSYVHNYTDLVFIPVTHSLNTSSPIIQVYNEVSELFIPQNIKVSGSNHVEIRLNQTGSGYVVIQKGGGLLNQVLDTGTYSSYAFPFSGQSSITVNHNLETAYPIVQVYNSAGYMIVPQDIRVLNSGSIEVAFPVNTLSGSISVAKGGHIISGSLQNAVSASYAEYIQSPAVRTHTIPFGISSPVVITTGEKGLKTIGREGKIIGWRLISDVSTTATLDVWKTNSAIPTNSNSICASSKPSLTAGVFNSSTTLTGWTTTFTSNDVFRVEVESNNTSTYLLLELDFLVDNN